MLPGGILKADKILQKIASINLNHFLCPIKTDMNKILIIRADSAPHIGAGHVMRTFSLAQEWIKNGYNVAYIYAEMLQNLKERLLNYSDKISLHKINAERGALKDAEETLQTIMEFPEECKIVLLDGYNFKDDYQLFIKNNSSLPTIYFDDVGTSKCYYTNIVFNQNINANENLYKCREPYTELLLGLKYVLLRDEFLKYLDFRRNVKKKPENLLILLGATDPENYTAKIVNILKEAKISMNITIISGQEPSVELLKALKNFPYKYELKQNVLDMPEVMLKADIAITAGGSTNWELSFMQVPLVALAKNDYEETILKEIHKRKLGIFAGRFENFDKNDFINKLNTLINDPKLRELIIKNQRQNIDGLGRKRVVDKLITLCGEIPTKKS